MHPVNSSSLYSYALIRALHEAGHDYVEVFYPFVLRSLSLDRSFSRIEDMIEAIKLRFGFNIPMYVLKVIIERAISMGYIEKHEKKYALTSTGKEFVESIEGMERKQYRRINRFITDMEKYLRNHFSQDIPSREIIEERFFKFIKTNVELLMEFINPSTISESSLESTELTKLDKALYEYILYIEEHNDEMFGIFRDIFLGAIISLAIFYDHGELKESFEPLNIYLDSNFIFSLLGLHIKERNKAAKELFEMLKENPMFKIKVFDFTLSEMVRVLNGYLQAIEIYQNKIRVDSLYDILRRKGWKKQQVSLFIATLENKIHELGIEIENTDINLGTYTPECTEYSESELRIKLVKYKPKTLYTTEKAFFESQNHDLAAICLIRKKRGKLIRKLEKSQAIFLTSDLRLSKFNLEIFNHKIYGTIPEVIPDKLFATILWLKNPSINPNLPINSVIASYSSNLLVSRAVWEKFYQVLKQLKEAGKISTKDIATLFYHDYIETVLLEFSEKDIEKIDEAFLLESIEEAKQKMKEDIERKITQQKEKELKEKYERKLREEQEKVRVIAQQDTIGYIMKRIEESSEREAKKYSLLITVGAVLGITCMVAYYMGIYKAFIAFMLSGGGAITEILKGYPKLKPYLYEHIKDKKLKELGLNET